MPVTRREVLSAIGGAVVGAVGGYALAPAREVVKEVEVEVPKKIKAGWIYVGPIGDLGWTYEHNAGRLYCEEVFGDALETVYIESVPEEACESEIDRLVAEGCSVIFTTSFGFMDPTAKKAAEYPDVIFEHCSGYKSGAAGNAPDNMGAYFAEFYQLYYLCGLAAGAMTKTNKIGYVAAHLIPEVVRHINAFVIGAREVNPNVEAYVIKIGAWYAPDKARSAAVTLIDTYGCDVLNFTEDSPTVLEVAEERQTRGEKVWSFSHYSDMKKFGPTAHLTGPVVNWGLMYEYILSKVFAGSWRSEDLWWLIGDGVPYRWARPVEQSTAGTREGAVFLAEINPVIPENITNLIKLRYEQMKEKLFEPFTGPLYDNTGKLRADEGERLTHDDLWTMDWFVEGIVSVME